MAKSRVKPNLVFADAQGNIYDHPDLLMLHRKGGELAQPKPDEIMPLPEESELFLLPARRALGLDPESGQVEALEENAVAAFISPGHTLTGTTAYLTHTDDACTPPVLPLFAYGAVGFANGRFWVAAKQVDTDRRQIFTNMPRKRIEQGAHRLLRKYPENRLVKHLSHCALGSCCPAARNLCLGRYEAPLPTARACNASCVGCISLQPEDAGFPSTQQRISFRPTVNEILEIMFEHAEHEPRAVYSFGQGCEGEPLTESELITEAVAAFRARGGIGTVNINTNASLPHTLPGLARAGLSSIRVSLNSTRPGLYEAYYRPKSYSFADVVESIATAKDAGLFVSLNLLYFPGVTDTEEELEALQHLVVQHGVDFIQLRNLNLDPERYMQLAEPFLNSPSTGLLHFRKRLRKAAPNLGFGYFNPFLLEGKRAAPYGLDTGNNHS